jgi:trimeric autotransporter adhesin
MKNLKTQLAVLVLSTICLLTGAFGQLTPSGDSYTSTATPTKNFGAATTLGVESSQTTFIQFNLSSIPSAYTSADITKATLKLFVDGVTTAGSFNVDYVNGTWTESTIDASNAPALGTTIAASVPLTSADKNQYVLVDVTAAVQAWLSGTPNDGIALVANSPLNATLDSKEATKTSHPAELDIVFAGGGTLTGITTASGSGLIGGGTSGTLNLSLTHSCAANQVLQYNGSGWICAATGTGTITGVTAGTDLTGGGTSGNVTLNLNTAATNALYAQLGAANTFTANQTVNGTIFATSTASAVIGNSTSSIFPAVGGGGSQLGVYGTNNSQSGAGVEGISANSTFGTGVIGVSNSTTNPEGGFGVGVEGRGFTLSGTGGTRGSQGAWGVWGDADPVSANGFTAGVLATADDNAAVYALNNGIFATIYAENDATSSQFGPSVFAAAMPNLLGVATYAIIGDAGCGSGFMALQLGQEGMSGCKNYTLMGDLGGDTYLNAGSGGFISFRIANGHTQMTITNDNVDVLGTLTKPAGSFKIDHPLDPANKYLYHSFVESPDMKNIYDGVAELDASGEAVIALPDWFQALNRDFRYQLTPIGAPGPNLYIAEEVANNQFKIAGGTPGSKVSWQVTGIRQDAYANAHRIPLEVEKAPADRGRYLYPEVIGQPETARIGYVAPPPGSEQIVHHQRPSLHSGNGSPARTITLPAPPMLVLPKAAPLPHAAPLAHPAAQASKPEVNQK